MYTRVDPFLAFSGRVGDIDDECGLKRVDDNNRNALVTYSLTGGPLGLGGWNYVGGNAAGDSVRMTDDSNGYDLNADEIWTSTIFRFNSFLSGTIRTILHTAVTNGDGGQQASLKPCIKLDGTTDALYLGNSNNADNDVLLYGPSLDTVYVIVLHCRGGTTGGAPLTHQAFIYSISGTELDTCDSSWAIGSAGSNNAAKWGNSGAGDTSGLNFDFSEMAVFRNISTNPGPCRVYAQRAISVIGAGTYSVNGGSDIQSAISENGSSQRTVSDIATTAASTAITSSSGGFQTDDAVYDAQILDHAGVGTNPARRIVSVTDANNATLDASTGVATDTGSAGIILRRGHDEDATKIHCTATTTGTLELELGNLNIPSAYEIHSVGVVVIAKTGTGAPNPATQLGVKHSGSSELLTMVPASTTAYNRRRGLNGSVVTAAPHGLCPSTSARWTPAQIDEMTALVKDNNTTAGREQIITNLHVQTVAAIVGGAPVTYDPAPRGIPVHSGLASI